jgi:hypothetical protein
MKLLHKPIQFVGTQAWNSEYGGLEGSMYIKTAMEVLSKHPVDMLIFEMPDDEHFQVRLCGYRLDKGDQLYPDETTIAFKTKSLEIRTFWLKIDDFGDKFVGTFMFPEDY